jgi:hypothetical protein
MDILYAMDVSKKAENKIKRLAFCLFMHCLTQQLATSRYEKKVPSHVMKSLSKSRSQETKKFY